MSHQHLIKTSQTQLKPHQILKAIANNKPDLLAENPCLQQFTLTDSFLLWLEPVPLPEPVSCPPLVTTREELQPLLNSPEAEFEFSEFQLFLPGQTLQAVATQGATLLKTASLPLDELSVDTESKAKNEQDKYPRFTPYFHTDTTRFDSNYTIKNDDTTNSDCSNKSRYSRLHQYTGKQWQFRLIKQEQEQHIQQVLIWEGNK
ncbi:hypothetical protein C942_03235 [Photobacterium marinum]|uniref:Uncharacterized protein n=2 Tax=Photobacterium marinum TaxID=1056511 RepID=L8J4U6_9GAMM|nr:hypothetical protein C942_03235 [Photobacterium marinum]